MQDPGSRFIKEFEVQEFLGYGGFGVVLKARNKLDMKSFAIKIAFENIQSDILREVQNLCKLPSHPNVAGYATSWKDVLSKQELEYLWRLGGSSSKNKLNGQNQISVLCIQMELCGEDLRKWLQRYSTVDTEKSTDIFLQIACGLQHIHKNKMIHRDLKSDNILFDLNDCKTIKIGDFGIAAAHDGAAAAAHTGNTGTIHYLAPEQFTKTYGKEVDLYALGLILSELFYPPAQEKLHEFFNDIKYYRKLPESVENRSIISSLILKLTSKDPGMRPNFKDIFEMLDYSPVASRTLYSRTISSEIQEIENRMSSNVIHKHVICDLCKDKDIRGIRYKCSVCPNFDLCEKCESRPGSHIPNHPMMKIKEASSFQVNNSQVKRTLLRDRLNLHKDNYNDEDDDDKLLAMLSKINSKIKLEANYSNLNIDNDDVTSSGQKLLVESLKSKERVKTSRVEKALLSVDRKLFCLDPYNDGPKSIGFGATISAPHMHAIILELIEKNFEIEGNILDIGSGSGYLTICMAQLLGKSGRVIGIDHIEELIEKSNVILKENFSHLKNKVVFVACDGRNGFPIGGPYDVINIGGAVTGISETILSQLKPGGRLVAPVGPMNGTQELVTIDKLDDGTLKRNCHLNVIFGSLISLGSQLAQLKKNKISAFLKITSILVHSSELKSNVKF